MLIASLSGEWRQIWEIHVCFFQSNYFSNWRLDAFLSWLIIQPGRGRKKSNGIDVLFGDLFCVFICFGVFFRTNYGKIKKANYLFVNVSHPSNEKNIAKSITILQICKRSFKWDLAGYSNFIHLEMALEWRQVVKNLEIHYAIFTGFLYSNIRIKRTCGRPYFGEQSK